MGVPGHVGVIMNRAVNSLAKAATRGYIIPVIPDLRYFVKSPYRKCLDLTRAQTAMLVRPEY